MSKKYLCTSQNIVIYCVFFILISISGSCTKPKILSPYLRKHQYGLAGRSYRHAGAHRLRHSNHPRSFPSSSPSKRNIPFYSSIFSLSYTLLLHSYSFISLLHPNHQLFYSSSPSYLPPHFLRPPPHPAPLPGLSAYPPPAGRGPPHHTSDDNTPQGWPRRSSTPPASLLPELHLHLHRASSAPPPSPLSLPRLLYSSSSRGGGGRTPSAPASVCRGLGHRPRSSSRQDLSPSMHPSSPVPEAMAAQLPCLPGRGYGVEPCGARRPQASPRPSVGRTLLPFLLASAPHLLCFVQGLAATEYGGCGD
jgi:hypothetical protein